MKLFPTLAVVGLASLAMFADPPAIVRADTDVSNQFKVAATQSGSDVNIVITPANDKVFINSEYPISLSLTPKSGGTVSQSTLGQSDGKYVASTHDGKALSVTFKVTASKGLTGTGKLVVCSLDACGNPTSFNFESK